MKLFKRFVWFAIPFLLVNVMAISCINPCSAGTKPNMSCTIVEVNVPILPEGEHGTVVLNCDGDILEKMKIGDVIKFSNSPIKKKKIIEGC